MFTKCPSCETWFAIGAPDLQRARGEVRCGRCLDSFDAFEFLRDSLPEPTADDATEQGAEPRTDDNPSPPVSSSTGDAPLARPDGFTFVLQDDASDAAAPLPGDIAPDAPALDDALTEVAGEPAPRTLDSGAHDEALEGNDDAQTHEESDPLIERLEALETGFESLSLDNSTTWFQREDPPLEALIAQDLADGPAATPDPDSDQNGDPNGDPKSNPELESDPESSRELTSERSIPDEPQDDTGPRLGDLSFVSARSSALTAIDSAPQGDRSTSGLEPLDSAAESETDETANIGDIGSGDQSSDPASDEPGEHARIDPTLPEASELSALDAIPEVLRDDFDKAAQSRTTRRRTGVFSALSIVAVAGMLVQYAWFMPDDVMKRYPQARNAVGWLCEHIHCRVENLVDRSQIQLISRDVRIHPKYEGALLVSAVFANRAAFAQSYPRVEFIVYNVNGQTVAARTFQPTEYLDSRDDTTKPSAGMQPEESIQVDLELLAPEEAAVSFEFNFH